MTFAIDFDGTLVSNAYPNIGVPKLDMIEKAKKLQAEGHTLILWTCRTGELLKNAVDFLKTYGLTFNYVNDHNVAYVEAFGEGGKKVGADYYVDDKCLSPQDFLNQEFVNI